MRLVAANVGHSLFFSLSTSGPAEPLDTTGRTLRLCGTPVEKHWFRRYWLGDKNSCHSNV